MQQGTDYCVRHIKAMQDSHQIVFEYEIESEILHVIYGARFPSITPLLQVA